MIIYMYYIYVAIYIFACTPGGFALLVAVGLQCRRGFHITKLVDQR
jgi:hypothetical protein